MKRFDTAEEALANAKQSDPAARELADGEHFGSLTLREASTIIDVHATGGGTWTWCYMCDMAD